MRVLGSVEKLGEEVEGVDVDVDASLVDSGIAGEAESADVLCMRSHGLACSPGQTISKSSQVRQSPEVSTACQWNSPGTLRDEPVTLHKLHAERAVVAILLEYGKCASVAVLQLQKKIELEQRKHAYRN